MNEGARDYRLGNGLLEDYSPFFSLFTNVPLLPGKANWLLPAYQSAHGAGGGDKPFSNTQLKYVFIIP